MFINYKKIHSKSDSRNALLAIFVLRHWMINVIAVTIFKIQINANKRFAQRNVIKNTNKENKLTNNQCACSF